MIPKFPQFIKLSLEHKPHLAKHILKYPPYSDFNFTSLISWGGEEAYISELNDNLVVKFRDYVTNEPFYTFLGVNKVNQTIKTLLGLHPNKLKLIPEVVLKADPKILESFAVAEDRDNFDYIYSLEETREFKGKKHRDKRNFVNRFKKLYRSSYKQVCLADPKNQQKILELFHHWQKLKGIKDEEIRNEFLALKRVLNLSGDLNLICLGIYISNQMVAFSINEVLADGYAMNLFEKADTTYQGIYPYLRSITAIYLLELGSKYLSHEQDLGIEYLRKSKMSYNPHSFLKKYTITHKK